MINELKDEYILLVFFSDRREADKVWRQGRSVRGHAAKYVKNLAVHVRSGNRTGYVAALKLVV